MNKAYILLFTTLSAIAILFYACSPQIQRITSTKNIYPDTHKAPQNTTVSYTLPIIKSTGKTEQSQTKGGVIISAEIVPFNAVRNVKQEKNVGYADNTQVGYDIYEISNTPYFNVSPEDINFKIRIRNNESVPLKLSEVGFAIIIDGTQWSFPSGYMDDWNKGLILTGFEKEYTIKGPQLQGLVNAQVVYIFLNGVPTTYDEAGNITKKSNFEWYFECKSTQIEKQEQISYTYESLLIDKRQCSKCSGTGTDPQAYSCTDCSGKGTYVSIFDGKTYTCSKCGGKGILHNKCPNCTGRGEIAYPKSRLPEPTSSVNYNGWQVTVVTIPIGATIKSIEPSTGEYTALNCTSPCKINWLSQSGKNSPITVEYGGKSVKVFPYQENGNPSPKIIVDFTKSDPFVKLGKETH